jgi:hypothetical protein
LRTKTRTTAQLKPGMVIKSVAFDGNDTPLDASYRQVARNYKPTPWAERCIKFTDGTYVMAALGWEYRVARGKAVRNATKTRAAIIPALALANVLDLLGGYARTAVAA